MENNTLDAAVNVGNILSYLNRKGVLSVHILYDGRVQVHLREPVFRELFPDVESEDGEFLETEYKGVKVVAVL